MSKKLNTYERIKGGAGEHLSEGEYPPDWLTGEIQRRIRDMANHHCEECGLEFEHGTNLSIQRKKGRRVIGTVHHIDWNKSNCTDDNLVYLCQACHYRIHLQGWKPGLRAPRAWARGLAYQMDVEQPTLFNLPVRK